MRLKNWNATPAGGAITVRGTDENGNLRTFTGCKKITGAERWYYERSWVFGALKRVTASYSVAEHPRFGLITLG